MAGFAQSFVTTAAASALAAFNATVSQATPGSWLTQLQPASWRGLFFAVDASEAARGRRTAVHTYPYRDTPWPEDIGRANRTYAFSAFVVGDDCYAQANALLDASEQEGSGVLVHPWLGTATVSLTEPVRAITRKDLGRVVELQMAFVEGSPPLYPVTTVSTQSQVTAATTAAQMAVQDDYVDGIGFVPTTGLSGLNISPTPASTDQQVQLPPSYTDQNGVTTNIGGQAPATTLYQDTNAVSTVTLYGDSAVQQAQDPSLIAGSVAGVQPPAGQSFDRFSTGNLGTLQPSTTTTAGALSTATTDRTAVSDAMAAAGAL